MHNSYVTTVIFPAQPENAAGQMAAVIEQIESQGGVVTERNWLCDYEVFDVVHTLGQLTLNLKEGCDIVTQPVQHRRKKLLISDMDSTLIEQECIDELAAYGGYGERVAKITEAAMRGELDFEAALKERVALLRGLKEEDLAEVYRTRISLMSGAKTLVQTMKKHGAKTVLVSGGFTFFTSRVAVALGFDEHHANELIIENGVLTGEVKLPILGKEAKLQLLQQSCAALDIDMIESLAVGDGANDLPMLQAAGLGVAYHAKPIVQQGTRAAINHLDLSALLYLQGYRQEEWAA